MTFSGTDWTRSFIPNRELTTDQKNNSIHVYIGELMSWLEHEWSQGRRSTEKFILVRDWLNESRAPGALFLACRQVPPGRLLSPASVAAFLCLGGTCCLLSEGQFQPVPATCVPVIFLSIMGISGPPRVKCHSLLHSLCNVRVWMDEVEFTSETKSSDQQNLKFCT